MKIHQIDRQWLSLRWLRTRILFPGPSILILLLLCLAAADPAGAATGPFGCWLGDGNAQDRCGTHHGTLLNGTGYGPGKLGQAFTFDGVDDCISIGYLPELQGAQEITITAWVLKSDWTTPPGPGAIVGKWHDGYASDNTFCLSDGQNRPHKGQFTIWFEDDGIANLDGNQVIPTNEWMHIVATWRNTDGLMALYKNGVLDAQGYGGVGKRLKWITNYEAQIGAYGGYCLWGPPCHHRGRIDQVAIYNRALSAAEISALYYFENATDLRVTHEPSSITENSGTVTLTVERLLDPSLPATIRYGVTGGTATPGVDFFLTNGVLEFAAGITNLTIPLTIIDDALVEGPETILLSLTNSATGWTNQVSLTLLDDDTGIEMESATYTVSEGAAQVVVGVRRRDDSPAEATVAFTTADGTARAGQDYAATAGTLTFAPGETNKQITVLILDDTLEEETETFTIALSNAAGGATLGLTRQSTVRIQDNEVPLHLGLVTYYPFNGNANDASGAGNHGTVYGAVLAMDRFGQTNACYRFNGTSAYIKAAASPLPTGVRTVSLWFNAETVENQPVLIGYGGNDCGHSFYMGLNLSHSAAYFLSPHCATFDLIQPFQVLPVNQWHHWVAVVDTTEVRTFLDGQLLALRTGMFPETFTSGRDLSLGVDVDANGYGPYVDGNCGYLQGRLDDIRIYNRPLLETEIRALYNYENQGTYSPSYLRTELSPRGTWTPTATNAPVHRVVISGTRAFVLDGNSEVKALDLSNPARPTVLGSWQPLFEAFDIEAAGNLLYIATCEPGFLSTVEIVDFNNPANPVLRGYYDTPGYAQDVALSGNTAYVADSDAGLLVLDVTDPALPTRLGGYDTLGSVRLVTVAGRHAYAVDGNWLLILDVSNPANPLRVGVHEVAGGINAVKAHGGRLYVLDGTGTLKLLDVSDPRNVTVRGSYSSWGAGGSGLAVSGKYAWLPLGAAGLQVLDVSNPTNLTWLAGAWINPAEDVALMGSYAVVAAGDRGLVIYELEQSIQPPLRPPVVAGGMMTFTWPALEGVRLQKCTNLVTRYWQDVPGSELTNTVILPGADPAAFFRLAKGPKPIPPPAGLVAWWSGDGDALDLVGTNHGILINGVTFARGMVGQALSLDGTDDYMDVQDNDLWAFGARDFTIDLWANFTSIRLLDPANPEFTFLGHDEGYGEVRKWFFALGGGLLSFHINNPDNGNRLWIAQTPFAFDPGTWYHLAISREATTFKIYANGLLVGVESSSALVPNANARLSIGQAEGEGYMQGQLDEMHIFNRALTAAEISAIYEAGSAGMIKPPR